MKQEDSHFVFKLVSGEEVIALTTMDDSGIEPCLGGQLREKEESFKLDLKRDDYFHRILMYSPAG